MSDAAASVTYVQDLPAPAHAGPQQAGPPAVHETLALHVPVTFVNGIVARFDPLNPLSGHFRRLLTLLQRAQHPAYVQLSPLQFGDVRTIISVHVPVIVQVTGLTLNRRGVSVTLHVSNTRHQLRRDNPRFEDLFATLRDALGSSAAVAVTENPADQQIIDVTPFNPPAESVDVDLPPPVLPPVLPHITPPLTITTVSKKLKTPTPQALFNLVSGQTCDPTSPDGLCIPFLFPRDGCWVRAHQMCRVIQAAGGKPRKLWISGDLLIQTANDRCCEVPWSFHVAAIVGSGKSERVIDPATCSGPVTRKTWFKKLNAADFVVIETDASCYRPHVEAHFGDGHNVFTKDDNFKKTEKGLVTYQGQLWDRTALVGPPPFKCP